jgi:hypothetical protein
MAKTPKRSAFELDTEEESSDLDTQRRSATTGSQSRRQIQTKGTISP